MTDEIEILDDLELLPPEYAYDMFSMSNDYDHDHDIETDKSGFYSKGFVKWTTPIARELWDKYKCKSLSVGVYETSTTPLCRIRRAITGMYTSYRVGTKDEDLFFVVNMATGLQGRKTPLRLFFDSPHDFERHCLIPVSSAVKDKWRQKVERC